MIRIPISGPAKRFTPSATVRRASMSSPESVSSRTASSGRSIASWRISIRFFSPPENPSLRYRLENSRGMFISSIAASVCLRKSFSLISASPPASRWELTAIRRYLATVTPGIATGYWNAMNRPARARSSGAASVTSSPLKRISPSLRSRDGCPMIAFASVDLPEPFGPMRAWISPADTSRSRPLRMGFPSALTCRFLISRSAIRLRCRGWWLGGATGDRRLRAVLVRELDELRERGARERLSDAAVDSSPEEPRRARPIAVGFVRAQHPALRDLVEAFHRSDRPLERLDDVEHSDLGRRPREPVTAVGAPDRRHEPGLAQLRDQVLGIGQGEDLGLRDRAQRDGLAGLVIAATAPTELDHQADTVFGLRREQHLG